MQNLINKSSTPLRETMRRFIDNFKWTVIISTIFVIIYIIISIITLGHISINDFRFMIIIFLGGVFSEIMNKSKGFFHSLRWISIGLYQGFLFFIYYIGVNIVNKSFTNYGPHAGPFNQVLWIALLLLGFTIIYLLPLNIVGGLVGFLAKHTLS